MGNRLKEISADNDLDFYANSWLNNDLGSENFVLSTVQYFKTSERKEIFKPLDFLNLLYKQLDNFRQNAENAPYTAVETLKNLPILSDEEKHILFGFILKWYGGYPFSNKGENYEVIAKSSLAHLFALILLEREFLSFAKETPEKRHCRNEKDNDLTISSPPPKAKNYQYLSANFQNISFNYDWDFFLNGKTINSSIIVFEIIDYFEIGQRKGLIEPLAFLNLFYKNYKLIYDNKEKPFSNFETLNNLPINEEIKHILFGFIIHWYGNNNSDNLINQNIKLIENEFLSYNKITAEKIKFGYEKNSIELLENFEKKSTIAETVAITEVKTENESKKTDNTKEKYREMITFYCEERTKKINKMTAENNALKKYGYLPYEGHKTFQRAVKDNFDIIDKYNLQHDFKRLKIN